MEKEYIRKAVGANLKKIRDHRGATQESTAQFLGMHASNYSRIERGVQKIHSEDLVWLAKHWGVAVRDFYEGIDEKGEELSSHFERTALKEQIETMLATTDDIETLRIVSYTLKRNQTRRRGRS